MAATLPRQRLLRWLAGLLAAVPAGAVVLITTMSPWQALLAPFFGSLYAGSTHADGRRPLDHVVLAAALAVPVGIGVQSGAAVAVGGEPIWTPTALTNSLPAVAGWVSAGTVFGLLLGPVWDRRETLFPVGEGSTEESGLGDEADPIRVVILGGGFAGFYAARRLETLFGPDQSVDLVLVSRTNALLFTPMLAEVVGGSLDPTDIATPLRSNLRRTTVIRAAVSDVNLDAQRVDLAPLPDRGEAGAEPSVTGRRVTNESSNPPSGDRVMDGGHIGESVSYDQLVIAVGSVSDYKGLEGVEAFAFDFKTLQDAMRLRSHIVACFERAVRTRDPARRRALLRFVIAGGGFAGAELAGAINDFLHELRSFYPSLPSDELEVTLVHSGERIMPELSPALSSYARERMAERGVEFRLGSYVEGADPDDGTLTISGGETIGTETLVWTAGVTPNPLVEQLTVRTDRGGIVTEPDFSVPEWDGVWAIGDCASTTDPATGEPFPPTAEFAVRAGQHLADNIHASVTGDSTRPMRYRSRGDLAVIGHQTACAELGRWRTAGLFAWVLWRAVYLAKLPGTGKKFRVTLNWLADLFFSRDIVQTFDDETREVLGHDR